MADIQQATGLYFLRKAIDQRSFGGTIEVDHHVAAEDGIEISTERPRLHQI
jgi:hypothetical protein